MVIKLVNEGDYIKLEDGREGMITWMIQHTDTRYLIFFRDNDGKKHSFFEGDIGFKVEQMNHLPDQTFECPLCDRYITPEEYYRFGEVCYNCYIKLRYDNLDLFGYPYVEEELKNNSPVFDDD